MKKLLARLLTLALTFALILALAAPAAFAQEAQSPSAVNWDDFYVIAKPQSISVPYNAGFTLSVQVNIPKGVEVEYYWFAAGFGNGQIGNAVDLYCSPGDYTYPGNSGTALLYRGKGGTGTYRCIITGIERDGSGNEISSKTLETVSADVRVENSNRLGHKLYNIFIAPIVIVWVFLMQVLNFS